MNDNKPDWGDKLRADYAGYIPYYPECNSGWDAIIREFMDVVKAKVPDPECFSVTQIKQKYGGLRISYGADNVSDADFDAITAAYDLAEQKSFHTCEETGKPGRLIKRGGWLMVVCDELMEDGDVVCEAPSIKSP